MAHNDTQIISRQFIFELNNETVVLDDPNINLPVETIKSIYANQYSQLINASIVDKGIVDSKMTYQFETIAGTKG